MEPKFLIWSIEHGAWWNPDHAGYTTNREKAGKYDQSEAEQIVRNANLGGSHKPNEAMVPAEDCSGQ